MRRWNLPEGRYVVEDKGHWVVYDRVGHVLTSGSAGEVTPLIVALTKEVVK